MTRGAPCSPAADDTCATLHHPELVCADVAALQQRSAGRRAEAAEAAAEVSQRPQPEPVTRLGPEAGQPGRRRVLDTVTRDPIILCIIKKRVPAY